MLTKAEKKQISEEYGRDEKDTGSPEVQVAMFTARINYLTSHLQEKPKDHDSRRGLLKLVGQRRSFLNYLMKKDIKRYRDVVKQLGIRK